MSEVILRLQEEEISIALDGEWVLVSWDEVDPSAYTAHNIEQPVGRSLRIMAYRIAELERDKERLDWIMRQKLGYRNDVIYEKFSGKWFAGEGEVAADTFRAAIDAAMAEEEGGDE